MEDVTTALEVLAENVKYLTDDIVIAVAREPDEWFEKESVIESGPILMRPSTKG